MGPKSSLPLVALVMLWVLPGLLLVSAEGRTVRFRSLADSIANDDKDRVEDSTPRNLKNVANLSLEKENKENAQEDLKVDSSKVTDNEKVENENDTNKNGNSNVQETSNNQKTLTSEKIEGLFRSLDLSPNSGHVRRKYIRRKTIINPKLSKRISSNRRSDDSSEEDSEVDSQADSLESTKTENDNKNSPRKILQKMLKRKVIKFKHSADLPGKSNENEDSEEEETIDSEKDEISNNNEPLKTTHQLLKKKLLKLRRSPDLESRIARTNQNEDSEEKVEEEENSNENLYRFKPKYLQHKISRKNFKSTDAQEPEPRAYHRREVELHVDHDDDDDLYTNVNAEQKQQGPSVIVPITVHASQLHPSEANKQTRQRSLDLDGSQSISYRRGHSRVRRSTLEQPHTLRSQQNINSEYNYQQPYAYGYGYGYAPFNSYQANVASTPYMFRQRVIGLDYDLNAPERPHAPEQASYSPYSSSYLSPHQFRQQNINSEYNNEYAPAAPAVAPLAVQRTEINRATQGGFYAPASNLWNPYQFRAQNVNSDNSDEENENSNVNEVEGNLGQNQHKFRQQNINNEYNNRETTPFLPPPANRVIRNEYSTGASPMYGGFINPYQFRQQNINNEYTNNDAPGVPAPAQRAEINTASQGGSYAPFPSYLNPYQFRAQNVKSENEGEESQDNNGDEEQQGPEQHKFRQQNINNEYNNQQSTPFLQSPQNGAIQNEYSYRSRPLSGVYNNPAFHGGVYPYYNYNLKN